jgi:tetratricopeptide (TPR) repeat protein
MSKISESDTCRKLLSIALGIFILAVAVRLFYLYESSNNPTFYAPVVDARGYDLLAKELAEQGKMNERFFWQSFFYPCFLSAVYFLDKSSILSAKIIQAFLGAAVCALTFLLGCKVFNKRIGILAGLFTVFCGPLIFHETELVPAGWSAFWAVALLLLFLTVTEKKYPSLFFVLGLCGALSVITQPNFLLFFVAACFWLAFILYRKVPEQRHTIVKFFAFVVSGFAAVAIPTAAINHRITGHFGILPATGGINLYIGNNPDFDAADIRPGIKWENLTSLPAKSGVKGNMWDKQQFFYQKTFDYIASKPADFLKGLLIKTEQFICSREMQGNVDIYLFRKWSDILKVLVWKAGPFGFPFGLLLPLGIIGLFCEKRQTITPAILFLIFYPLPVILAHVESRYRAPIIPLLSIFAAAGCFCLAAAAYKRNWLRLTGLICVGLAAALVSTLAGPFAPEKSDYQAELYLNVGTTLKEQGKIDDAIKNYNKALELKPNYSEAYYNLGVVFYGQDKINDAVNYYEKAILLDPADYKAHCGLGTALYKLGEFEQAQQHYLKAIEINPDYPLAHKNLALEFVRQDKIELAESQYKKSIEADPADADAQQSLGMLLARQEKFDEAIEHLEKAISIKPDSTELHKSLGTMFVMTGRTYEAFEHFREALRLNPADAETRRFLDIVRIRRDNVRELPKALQEISSAGPNDPCVP